MTVRRIAKLFIAQNATQVVTVISQLLLPPAFLHIFGVSLYGQWVALSASVSYLSTFNYGLQTYTNMQMTIHYNRGEVQECREVQSAGLRMLLGAFLGWSSLLLVVFLMPLSRWLNLTISDQTAHWTLYFLGLQVISAMLFGFFSGSYMVFGEAHRGAHLANANQLLGMLTMVALILLHMPFPAVAAGQVLVTLLLSLFLFFDLSRRAPQIRPTVRYWKQGSFASTLKPSAQYMLLASSNLLAYQVPILLMQTILGPAAVVVYSVTRTIYSMSRRVMFLVTNSLGPEVTMIYGKQDWPRLHRLYELSERIILLLTPPITFGSMLATPLLLQVWLHKGQLFDPGVCIALGLTVSVLSIKEHKYQFQFSSNKVSEISSLTLISYCLMCVLAIPAMYKFGVLGFLVEWLVFETAQLFYLLGLNDKLFGKEADLDRKPVYQLFAILAVCTVVFAWPVYHIASYSYLLQAVSAAVTTLITGIFCYWIFQVDEVRDLLWQKITARIPALAGKQG